MEQKTAYYSDTGSIGDLVNFIAKNPELFRIPEHGMEGGRTLLHIAASYGSLEVCEDLIGRGISINASARSSGGKLPIGEAAAKGHVNLVRWLLENGSAVDGPPEAVTTPLMDSAINGHESVVALLLERGADVNRLHLRLNQTPLDLALIYKQEGAAHVLRSAGGKLSIEPIDFSTEGAGILEHIEERVGSILSGKPKHEFASLKIEYLTALIRGAKDCKLFFSYGVHQVAPRVEFVFCLQSDWPLSNAGLSSENFVSFPFRILLELTKRRLGGSSIEEGDVFDRSTLSGGEVFWPDGIDAVVAIDYQFDHVESKERVEGDVKILALVPIKYTKSGRPVGKKMTDLVAKLRTSSWKKISLRTSVGGKS
ncbi:ankyrin repeat domain-containing protein [Paraburkholderia sp. Ac-20340]|uniref:ankyrin repeat domain-containing protein n=1 Tax=Paraburkholderia sp. Ac-20340 TaxID=2703888 RepID=UPI00197CF03E|nr:ankyrin repeat domain-containing protein [Paraburkholderia sp. Ac-20340]MBN3854779.1 ankyrin repeat domain-containing protein [Paraburkholderia sp. Ac-20340]